MADLDERLRDIARGVEPSIRLAHPEAVRARGRRRRARQRAAITAAAVLAVAAVTAGSWRLLPGDDSTRTLPAAPPAPRTDRLPGAPIPASALLRPSALPFDAMTRWKTVGPTVESTDATDTTGGGRAPLLDLSPGCRLDGPHPLAQRTRDYQGRKAERARHTINAYASGGEAAKVFASLEQTLKDRCARPKALGTTPPAKPTADRPTTITYGWRSSRAPHDAQVVLMRSGARVAVLQTEGIGSPSGDYTDGPSAYCVSVSLWRLDPTATASPGPYRSNPEEAKRRC
ncbi:hypothetical protein [Streptomyces malaysiensis]|uniref:Uncharacterized protein n=1 Tax=Streptomyces malaysiensis subsp. samsunensis TaxID=459658 RepID=A0A9X2M3H7_STRMQ|nr:hypothetical protein [Streptomyces samsunensis]MCQ8834991.1 hypothetical protein [Streptomyces samsunensis]